jgi:uncharacterized protein YciI
MPTILMVVFAMLLAAPPAPAADPAGLYVLIYRQGPAWKAEAPPRGQTAMTAHGVYMKKLFDAGVTLAAGPTTDTPGGVVLLHADSLAQAQALMAADPSIISGMFIGEAHSWSPVFRADKPLPASHLDLKSYGDTVLKPAAG